MHIAKTAPCYPTTFTQNKLQQNLGFAVEYTSCCSKFINTFYKGVLMNIREENRLKEKNVLDQAPRGEGRDAEGLKDDSPHLNQQKEAAVM